MKIVKNTAAAGVAKSGVAAEVNPFKRVMSGASGAKQPKGSVVQGPVSNAAPLPHVPTKPAAKPPPLPGGVTPKRSIAATKAQSQVLTPPPVLKAVHSAQASRETARAQAHVKADNLVELRKEAVAQNTQRYDTRLVDLICQELKIEFGGDARGARRREAMTAANSDRQPPAQQQHHVASVTPIGQAQELAKAQADAAVKAASAVELIEKIETFVKSQRPGLAITLDGSLGARVEIERLGPKEVAIRVVGKNGPPAPEDIGRIREEMRARGLKVGALSVA